MSEWKDQVVTAVLAWRQGDADADAILREYGDHILRLAGYHLLPPCGGPYWDCSICGGRVDLTNPNKPNVRIGVGQPPKVQP